MTTESGMVPALRSSVTRCIASGTKYLLVNLRLRRRVRSLQEIEIAADVSLTDVL